MILVLSSNQNLPCRGITLDPSTIYSGTHCVSIRVESFLVSLPGGPIMFLHSRSFWIVLDSNTVFPIIRIALS